MPVPPSQVNPPLGYGHDVDCVSDVTTTMSEVDGRKGLAQALVRRLQTPAGGLIDDPNYGYDITGAIDDDLTKAQVGAIAARIDAELLKDERVLRSTTTATYVGGALTVATNITDLNGAFKLTIVASNVTVALLKVSPS